MTTLVKEGHTDILRKGVSYAVEAGRKMQSPTTGFIHHCYNKEEDSWHTIPTIENALFVLALFRTRTVDNIQEGKGILQKILAFQSEAGNFPVYLHEYPQCLYPLLPIRLLPIFNWILKHYHHVIGAELRVKLQESQYNLLRYCLQYEKKSQIAYHSRTLLAGALVAYGKQVPESDFLVEGERLWKVLRQEIDFKAWNTPRCLGDILTGIQMAFSDMKDALGDEFVQHLSKTWNGESGAFVGPPIKEYYYEKSHELTLYELFMSYLTKTDFNKKHMESANLATVMQTALIHPWKECTIIPVVNAKESGEYNGNAWQQISLGGYSIATCDISEGRLSEDGLHALRVSWDGNNIICPRGKYSVESVLHSDRLEMFFTLPEDIDFDNNRHCSEIGIYCHLSDSLNLKVDNAKATTFQLGEQLTLEDDKLITRVAFHLEDGEGDFFGHMMRGNRPSQLKAKGPNRFSAYDSMIVLRTVRRSKNCRIKMEIYFERR
jgi:hypothetical protein